MDILIRNAKIATQDSKRRVIDGDVFICGNRIAEVGRNLKEKAEEKIDGKGKLIFPGLVNAHTHIAMALFRGYGEGMRLQDWLGRKIWPAEAKLKPNDVYAGTMLGTAEMIRSGTASFNEMYVIGLEKISEAAEKSGMRASIALGMFGGDSKNSANGEMGKTREFASKLKSRSGRVKPAVSCHAPYTCSPELIAQAKGYANEKGMQFHIHASETRKEVFDLLAKAGKRPLEYLEGLGAMDSRTVLAHSVFVTKREIALAGKAGASVAHSPISNLKLAGGGICPIVEFAKAGANATLGTDGAASNNSLNMIETMKMAALLQKNHYWDPLAVSAGDVLDYATINGAKALGIDAGSIEKGKLADIVIADMQTANMAPSHDPVANLVYSMNPSNITDVIVNGEFALREGKITKFDELDAIEKASRAAADLVARAKE